MDTVKIYQQVAKKFPEISASAPASQSLPGGKTLLIFKSTAKTADGKVIHRTVRVVVSADGKIEKMSTSR